MPNRFVIYIELKCQFIAVATSDYIQDQYCKIFFLQLNPKYLSCNQTTLAYSYILLHKEFYTPFTSQQICSLKNNHY